ncbi:MAG: hypothetical protein HDR12_06640 [Lachnospiraceae bacterium]|nr:hypothetical protein [Lachnospiraceae bacterium]
MYDWIVILCVVSGAYLMYAAIEMKYKGRFLKNVVLGNGMNENSIRDKEGFVKYLYIRLLLCGGVDVFIGIACLVCDFITGQGYLIGITNVVLLISFIAYGIFINKALKKYVKR